MREIKCPALNAIVQCVRSKGYDERDKITPQVLPTVLRQQEVLEAVCTSLAGLGLLRGELAAPSQDRPQEAEAELSYLAEFRDDEEHVAGDCMNLINVIVDYLDHLGVNRNHPLYAANVEEILQHITIRSVVEVDLEELGLFQGLEVSCPGVWPIEIDSDADGEGETSPLGTRATVIVLVALVIVGLGAAAAALYFASAR